VWVNGEFQRSYAFSDTAIRNAYKTYKAHNEDRHVDVYMIVSENGDWEKDGDDEILFSLKPMPEVHKEKVDHKDNQLSRTIEFLDWLAKLPSDEMEKLGNQKQIHVSAAWHRHDIYEIRNFLRDLKALPELPEVV
tara:strand:+ start:528 stop:932 length:405 start_codon:yes stop_codon:yes gene_type:complete